jgi:hypothetical protein
MVSRKEFEKKTVHLLRLARSALIYLMIGVRFEEERRKPRYAKDATHFIGATRDLNDTIRGDALPFAGEQNLFRGSVRRGQQPSQAISRQTALAISQLRQSLLSSVYLTSQFSTVLTSHDPLESLDNGAGYRTIVRKAFGTIVNGNPGGLAQKFIVGSLIRILEPPPTAHVIYENCFVDCNPLNNILN